MLFDYETLRIIWWAFLGLLLMGFAIMSGFYLGVGVLLPLVAKTDEERGVLINATGTGWDGNQVWLVLAGGVLFAAWPVAYAVSFSTLFFVLLLSLFSLFLSPLGFGCRSKLSAKRWRGNWDKALFVGGVVPAVMFGIAFGNLLTGLPFYLEGDMRIIYQGSFWSLFQPFALLAGLLSLSMLVMQGAVYLQIKTVEVINDRAKKVVFISTLVTLALFALAGYWVTLMEGYHISSEVFPDGPSNPLLKTVKQAPGLWLDNYGHLAGLWAIPGCTFVAGLMTWGLSKRDQPEAAFIFSSIAIASIILTAGCSMFPFIAPSSLVVNHSLTVWDASASLWTLNLMFWGAVICWPFILVYSGWIFRALRCKLATE